MPRIPGVNHLDAVRALEKAGFQVVRQGKHIVLSDGRRQVTLRRNNPIKAITMGGIARDAGGGVPQPAVAGAVHASARLALFLPLHRILERADRRDRGADRVVERLLG
ncbi:MAG: type II toxin-antitoxin system HicA family toxin [Isosphaeraceae bacterium]